MSTSSPATIEDLYEVEGKAELVNGEIVMMSPAGFRHNRTAGKIYRSLLDYEEHSEGVALTDCCGFLCDLPHRQSFSPDTAFYFGPHTDEEFLPQPPDFAVEVRSTNDFTPQAEQEIAAKRSDYFNAGTKVVWDVDPLREKVVRVYRASDPENPIIYRRGETAEAEPAVPGWTMPVDEMFE